LTMRHDNLLDLLRAVVARAADATALIYFDRLMSYRELDETSEPSRLGCWTRASFPETGLRSCSRTIRSS
jgi:non-ribosomal peptide synthetase component E (peptide arylation enzyme)